MTPTFRRYLVIGALATLIQCSLAASSAELLSHHKRRIRGSDTRGPPRRVGTKKTSKDETAIPTWAPFSEPPVPFSTKAPTRSPSRLPTTISPITATTRPSHGNPTEEPRPRPKGKPVSTFQPTMAPTQSPGVIPDSEGEATDSPSEASGFTPAPAPSEIDDVPSTLTGDPNTSTNTPSLTVSPLAPPTLGTPAPAPTESGGFPSFSTENPSITTDTTGPSVDPGAFPAPETPVPTVTKASKAPSISFEGPPMTSDTAGPTVVTDMSPTASGMLTPTEVAEERARTRGLLPFTLVLEGQFRVDDAGQVLEMYLFRRLSQPFDSLEWILLTVTSADRRRRRALVERTYNFTGVAIFYDSDSLPTQKRVHEEQLRALRDFHVLNDFVRAQDFNWTINTIILDGITIDEDGMTIGDSEIENDGDTAVRGGSTSSNSDNDAVAIPLSLAGVIIFLGILGCVFFRRRIRRRKDPEELESGESLAGLMRAPDRSKDTSRETQNISFDAPTLATASFDSEYVHANDYKPQPSSPIDWNRVFALSRTPVEDTFGEIFEAKELDSPKDHKTHEIVTLAPVDESRSADDGAMLDDEDSYGYMQDLGQTQITRQMPMSEDSYSNTMDNQEENLPFDVSPIGSAETSVDYDNGQDNDITIDLDDFDESGNAK